MYDPSTAIFSYKGDIKDLLSLNLKNTTIIYDDQIGYLGTVKSYMGKAAPAINIPKVGHTIKGDNGIISRSIKGITSAR